MSAKTRETEILAFLNTSAWAKAQRHALPADASTRRYERLTLNEKSAILMDAPPVPPQASPPASPQAPKTISCPQDADPAARMALGYTAIARLAEPGTHAFAALACALGARGFSAPKVYAADHKNGLLLLEDLGDALFSVLAGQNPLIEPTLYSAATETLAALSRSSFSAKMTNGGASWHVADYDTHALLAETDLLLQWYAPDKQNKTLDKDTQTQIQAAWTTAFAALGALPKVLTLRDVHAENLLWLPSREGHARAGLIDFQDAVFGSPAYDLVSLLQDARRDLPPGLESEMKALFLQRAKLTEPDVFDASYAVLGAQRAAKILGIFVRLAKRDGKPRYLDFLPRTAAHLVRNLEHPVLHDVQKLLRAHVPAVFDEVGPDGAGQDGAGQ